MNYPIQLTGLEGAPVLVAGGGEIALRKVEELLETGACVEVVTLWVSEAFSAVVPRLAKLTLRAVEEADVDGKRLVIAATDDRAVNRRIALAATRKGILVNAVDDPEVCTFYASATVRRGPATIAIGTDGKAPLLAAQLRRLVEALLPESVGSVGELLAGARKRGLRGLAKRSTMLRAMADAKLGRLVERGETEAAQERLAELARRTEEPFAGGTVAIVGAGPGGRAHLTLRALDRIQRADVIVHDALVLPEVLSEAMPGTRLIDMGRRCDRGGPDQSLTNALIIKEARAGLRVVRLHAGDPGVFGRAGEEIDELDAAGVKWELVPAVSSALAAPALAGVPLTRRGEARGFRVRTGHVKSGYLADVEPSKEEDTLVIMMGLGHARDILAGLVEQGMSPDTPAAAIGAASWPEEQVVTGTLGTLAERIAAVALEGPATLVVGEVAKRARAKGLAAKEEVAA